MRLVLLIVAALFTGFIAVFTVLDLVNNGVNVINLLAALIVVLFATGILGALTHRPPPQ